MVLQVLEEINAKGFIRIKKIDFEIFYEIALKLGTIIQETDVVINMNSKAMVTSNKALDFHTDHHKAKYIGWYCLNQTDSGGETILTDALKIFNLMPKKQQDDLMNVYLHEHKIFEDDESSYPLVKISNDKPIFYYSFWLVKDNLKESERIALKKFQDLIKEQQSEKFKLEVHDALFIDNTRILHGRTAIEGSVDRHLKRIWINI